MGHYDSCRGEDVRCAGCGRWLGDSANVVDTGPFYCEDCQKQKPLLDKIKKLEKRVKELEGE